MKKTVITVTALVIVAVIVTFGTYYFLFRSAYNDMPEIAMSKVIIQLSNKYEDTRGDTYYANKKELTYTISKTKSGYIVEIGGWAHNYNNKQPLYAKVIFDSRCGFEKIEKLYVRN